MLNRTLLNKYDDFQIYMTQLCIMPPAVESRWSWKSIILSDAIGILGGAIASVVDSGGASALPNPLLGGVPTASVVGLVVGATASVTAAVN